LAKAALWVEEDGHALVADELFERSRLPVGRRQLKMRRSGPGFQWLDCRRL
jgi:hypothetical protein